MINVYQTSTETPISRVDMMDNIIKIYYKWNEYTEKVWITTFLDNGFDINDGDICLIHNEFKGKLSPIPSRFEKQIMYSDYVKDGTAMLFMKPFDMTGYMLMPQCLSS